MQNLLGEFKHYLQWFWEALFPPKCLICKKEGADFCLQHRRFEKAPKNAVDYQYLDDIFAATRYRQKSIEKLIEYFKFKNFRHLSKTMAEEIYQHIPDDFLNNTVLVPIPLHWTRYFWRGFNQSEELMKSLISINPSLTYSTQLKRVKKTKQQAKLERTDRLKNLRNAFAWKGVSIPSKVTLVDDVVASGSTLESAAKILKDIGVKEVRAIVFARGG